MTDASDIIEATILRDTLISLSPIQSLVTYNGQQMVFFGHVDPSIPLPYIFLTHYTGGDEKDGRYSDSCWLVVGHSANIATANALANAINGLKDLAPITTSYPDACAYAPLKRKGPYFQRSVTQNTPLFRSGGIYRIQLYLGE